MERRQGARAARSTARKRLVRRRVQHRHDAARPRRELPLFTHLRTMRRSLFLLLGLLALQGAAPAQIQFFGGFNGVITDGDGDTPVAAPAKGETQLRWQNGEVLTGQPVDATETELSWKNPLFTEPLHVRWDELRRISRELPSAQITEAFAARLRDGSHLYGDLKSVTADTVNLHSRRHGDFSLKRSEVLSVRRLRGGSLSAAGPTGDVGW